MLDAVVQDKPVYAFAYDFHSVWVNSAALAELGIDDHTKDPHGGTIKRDADGHATGYIDENAFYDMVLPPYLDAQVGKEEHEASIAAVQQAYRETGVTTACDMGFNETDLEGFKRADKDGTLTSRLIAYWRVNNAGSTEENIAQVQRAAALAVEHESPFLRVVGIKVIIDGTIDGCTATLGMPYADGSNAEPIWSLEELAPVVAAADAAGLKVAMHAIGDESVRIAIGAVEHAVAENGPPRERRHRIEHLELVDRADVDRLAALGITASMQPVHADPAISENWAAKLGDDRVERGFPWPWITEAGARLAFGTDSPTSPHAPLPNMYVATTRLRPWTLPLEPMSPASPCPSPSRSNMQRAIPRGRAGGRSTKLVGWLLACTRTSWSWTPMCLRPGARPRCWKRRSCRRWWAGGRCTKWTRPRSTSHKQRARRRPPAVGRFIT